MHQVVLLHFCYQFDPRAEVEVLSENSVKVKVDKQCIPSVIGRGGATINELEKVLQVHIDVVPRDSFDSSEGYEIPFNFSESKTSIILDVGKENSNDHGDIFVNDKFLTSSRIDRKGHLKISKRSDAGRHLLKNASSQNDIQIFIK